MRKQFQTGADAIADAQSVTVPKPESAVAKLPGRLRAAIRTPVSRPALTLGFRLNLSITLLLVLILALGITFVIRNARGTVFEETHASASLALQLLGTTTAGSGEQDDELWQQLAHRVGELKATRHLGIVVRDARGIEVASVNADFASRTADAPAWFVRLVTPRPIEFRRHFGESQGSRREIVVRSNPADEITEAWGDSKPLLLLQLLFALLVEGLVFVIVGRALRPLGRLRKAFDEVGRGHLHTRLPQFRLPELADISHQFNRMVEALEQEKRTNQRLVQRTLSIQEEERRYMANELHDELGQSISAIKALAVSIRQRADDRLPRVCKNANSIVEIVDRTHGVIRTMVYRLRPPVLEAQGLVSALQRMVDDWNDRHADTFCYLRTDIPMVALSDAASINLYRIVQECLTNVARHASANQVNIDLHVQRDSDTGAPCLRLGVGDDGVGLTAERKDWGLGLRGIHDRVGALDGTIRVSGSARNGSLLDITLPLPSEPEVGP